MIRNICKLRFRSLTQKEVGFTEIKIAYSGNILEISDEDNDAGKLYKYRLEAKLNQPAFYRYDYLQFDVTLSDGTHIFVGNSNYPAILQTSEDLDGAKIKVEWKDIYPPVFSPVS